MNSKINNIILIRRNKKIIKSLTKGSSINLLTFAIDYFFAYECSYVTYINKIVIRVTDQSESTMRERERRKKKRCLKSPKSARERVTRL